MRIWIFLIATITACAEEPAQTLVELDAEGMLASAGHRLSVCVENQEGEIVYHQSVDASWPARVPISPKSGDRSRVVGLLAELRSSSGELLGRQRVRVGFPTAGLNTVRRTFSESCWPDPGCLPDQTCVAGQCVSRNESVLPTALGSFDACIAGPRCDPAGCRPELQRSWRDAQPEVNPGPRWAPKMAYHRRIGKVVMYGGKLSADGIEPVVVGADMWTFDGNTWEQVCETCPPGPRWNHALVYDNARSALVLFGGTGVTNSVWEWDGQGWTERELAGAPPPLELVFGAYDNTRGRAVFFGGRSEQSGWNDQIYEYDGERWYAPDSASRPAARIDSSEIMTYDALEERAVVVAGREVRNDAWAWDGTDWTQICDGCFSEGKQQSSLVFDSTTGKTLLHGGWVESRTPQDGTFVLSGGGWDLIDASPGGRNNAGIAFDERRDRVVMYGGSGTCAQGSNPFFCDETLEYVVK